MAVPATMLNVHIRGSMIVGVVLDQKMGEGLEKRQREVHSTTHKIVD